MSTKKKKAITPGPAIVKRKNSKKKPWDWFIQEDYREPPETSHAEQRIINVLNKRPDIKYHREVSFRGLYILTSKYEKLYYRFDFFIPGYNLIIEYDGEQHRYNIGTIANDAVKNEFCKKYRLNLVRFNKKHWSNLEECILTAIEDYKYWRPW